MSAHTYLTDQQIVATLERHGYSPDTNVLGISYGDIVTVNVYAAVLIVPTDILQMVAAPPPAPGPARLLS